jgi:hypothetical protein
VGCAHAGYRRGLWDFLVWQTDNGGEFKGDIERLAPRSPLELGLLPPVFLDYYLNDSGGYDVGRLPYLNPAGFEGEEGCSKRFRGLSEKSF